MTGEIDFLVIGAEKSGTTWLADMLRQHPAIFIPPEKELFYFNERFFESPELPNYNAGLPVSWYLAFFQGAGPGQLKGEASPAYLWDKAAAGRIAAFDPGLGLVAVLRDPIDRAFSQYLYYIQRGVTGRILFEEALERRPDMLSRGLYARQLRRYLDLFPRDLLYIAFYDDLRQDSARFLAGVQDFLGVSRTAPANLHRAANVTGEPRFPIVNRAISWLRYPLRKYNPPALMWLLRRTGLARLQERIRLANTRPMEERPGISTDTRERLAAYFRSDVEELERISGRDLASWLQAG